MLSKFFLDRPVFAWVIAIVIMLVGALAIYNLPISQYPPIAPPSIYIQAFYPGASAETVENSVTQVIEQKMTGLTRYTCPPPAIGQARVGLTALWDRSDLVQLSASSACHASLGCGPGQGVVGNLGITS
jgi:HAE1 family hydrophobic/amphiphilic exporter-1